MESYIAGGFIAVTYKIGDENPCNRHLFVKKHEGKDDCKPSDRTLLVLNIPQYINRKCLKFLYKHCGTIKHIYIHSKPKDTESEVSNSVFSTREPNLGYKVAYVVFDEPSGLKSALKTTELPPIHEKRIHDSLGLSKWIHEYNSAFLDIPKVTQEIETFMKSFDEKQEQEKLKNNEIEADEEGWVTVTTVKKKAKLTQNGKVSKKILNKLKKDATKKTLLNFYRCQLRDAKMEEILELRKKFDKDKERIAMMKANRKFKPY